MSPEWGRIVAGLAAGLAIGGVYFGLLWLTVARLPRARHPYRWFYGGLALRLGAALALFYLLLPLGWKATGAALLGFFASRQLWVATHGRRGRSASARIAQPATAAEQPPPLQEP